MTARTLPAWYKDEFMSHPKMDEAIDKAVKIQKQHIEMMASVPAISRNR